nr:MAG TPA: hypothetical protein [Caudoviricetes sp.]
MPCRFTTFRVETSLSRVLRISNISCATIKVNTKVVRCDKKFLPFLPICVAVCKKWVYSDWHTR